MCAGSASDCRGRRCSASRSLRERLADLRCSTCRSTGRAGGGSYRGASHRFLLPRHVGQPLVRLARRPAAHRQQRAAGRLPGAVGTGSGHSRPGDRHPVSRRDRPELDELNRLFRQHAGAARAGGRPAVVRRLRAARARASLDAMAHQELPFDLLVQALQPDRDLGRNPLYQVVFQLVHAATRHARQRRAGTADAAGRARHGDLRSGAGRCAKKASGCAAASNTTRPVRCGDGRAAGRPLRTTAAGRLRRPRARARRAAVADRRRAPGTGAAAPA